MSGILSLDKKSHDVSRRRGQKQLRFSYAAFFRRGTFAPERRASDNPMAIACFGFVTLRPLPERNFPRLNSCISSSTFLPALGPYRLPELLEPLRALLEAEVFRADDFSAEVFLAAAFLPDFFAAVFLVRVPEDFLAAVFREVRARALEEDFFALVREREDFFVAIGLASFLIRRTSKRNRLRD